MSRLAIRRCFRRILYRGWRGRWSPWLFPGMAEMNCSEATNVTGSRCPVGDSIGFRDGRAAYIETLYSRFCRRVLLDGDSCTTPRCPGLNGRFTHSPFVLCWAARLLCYQEIFAVAQ